MTEAEAIRKAIASNPEAADQLRKLIDEGKLSAPGEMPPDEPLVLIGGPSPVGITGAKQFRCQCGNIIWLSPSSLDLMEKHPGEKSTICLDCMLKMNEAEKLKPS